MSRMESYIKLRQYSWLKHKKCIDQNWEHLVMWISNLLLSSVFMRFYTLSVVICPPPPQLSPPPLQSKIPHPKSRESHCSGFSPENLGFPGSSGFSPVNLGKPSSWNLKSSFLFSFFFNLWIECPEFNDLVNAGREKERMREWGRSLKDLGKQSGEFS